MGEDVGMRISFVGAFGYLLPIILVLGVVGAAPTLARYGRSGLSAELIAGGLVLTAMILSAAVVTASAKSGPASAAMAFAACGIVRPAVCMGGFVAAVKLTDTSSQALLIWLLVFYFCALVGEGAWIVRALRRNTHLKALQKLASRRPGGDTVEIGDDD